MTNAQIVPTVLVPYLVWRYYRRFRRTVGRQSVRPVQMAVSIALMCLVLCLVGVSVTKLGASLLPLAGGSALGIAVGVIGYRLTRFEVLAEGNFYTPNAYLGMAITLLFVGRLVYRFAVLYSSPGLAPGTAPSLGQSPLTLLVFGLTLGYYIAYKVLVLFRLKNHPAH